VDEAVATLRSLAPHGVELCEEPVHGVAELAAVRERLDGEVAIAMDETAREAGAIESGAADFVCLKVAACGGVTRLWEAAGCARGPRSRAPVRPRRPGWRCAGRPGRRCRPSRGRAHRPGPRPR